LAADLKTAIMELLCEPDIRLRNLWRANKSNWSAGLTGVMLESLIETLTRDTPRLTPGIASLFRGARPTEAHHIIAALLAARVVSAVITTNFDELLEQAYTQLRRANPKLPRLHVVINGHRQLGTGPMLIKLHGSASEPRSLSLTLAHIGHRLIPWKQKVVKKCADHPFVFIGYSDQDKDITPVLATLRNRWLWLLHSSLPVAQHVPPGSPIARLLARRGVKTIYTDVPAALRMFAAADVVLTRPPSTSMHPDWREKLRRLFERIDFSRRGVVLGDIVYERLRDLTSAEAVYDRGLAVRGLSSNDRIELLLHRNRGGGDAWQLDELENALKRVDRLAASGAALPSRIDALRLRQWSVLYQKKSVRLSEDAERLCHDEERMWWQAGKKAEAANAALNRAVVLQKRGRYKAAEPVYKAAIVELRQEGQMAMVAKALSNFGSLLGMTGRNRRALEAYREAADIFHMIGDHLCAARANVNMSIVLTEMGRPQAALRLLRPAVSMLREFNDSYWLRNAAEAVKQARRVRK
jgi:tetratricopeptide (TPR) repeat protein